MRLARGLCALGVVALFGNSAWAAGFRLLEAGAKAQGMGFAFVAQADDPSAIYYNPAGITQLDGINFMGGATVIFANGAKFTGVTPLTGGAQVSEAQKTLHFFVPHGYYTQRGPAGLAWGLGVFSPYGLGQEYEDRRTSIFRNQITKIELISFVINPVVAYKIADFVSVAAGLDFMYGHAILRRTAVLAGANQYLLDLKGHGTTLSYNFGAWFSPFEGWRLGVSHRGPFKLKIKSGDVSLSEISSAPLPSPPFPPGATAAAIFGGSSFDTKGDTEIDMPSTTAVGMAYTWDRMLTVEADADLTWWSTFQKLAVDFQNNTPLLPNFSSPKNWSEVVALRVGAELRPVSPLAVRLGFAYDPTPVPGETMGPELPDSIRFDYMLGAGYTYESWTFDAAYFFLQRKDRSVNNLNLAAGTGFNGLWSGLSQLVGLSISARF